MVDNRQLQQQTLSAPSSKFYSSQLARSLP
jgi:hypothetical protein